MTIPFVIDNQDHKLADVLNDLLARGADRPRSNPPAARLHRLLPAGQDPGRQLAGAGRSL